MQHKILLSELISSVKHFEMFTKILRKGDKIIFIVLADFSPVLINSRL
jgi:hypothetical protein